MQFTKPFKQAIAAGQITTTFRVWRAPQAKAGGRYNIPPYGAIEVSHVKQLPFSRVKARDIKHAGFEDAKALAAFLKTTPEDSVYQVDFRYLGEAAVNQPATQAVSAAELTALDERLTRMDRRAPWTRKVLRLIAKHPAVRAGDLAPHCDMDLPTFKRNVRRLKSLGLTISLETGYKLSPLGEQFMAEYAGCDG